MMRTMKKAMKKSMKRKSSLSEGAIICRVGISILMNEFL